MTQGTRYREQVGGNKREGRIQGGGEREEEEEEEEEGVGGLGSVCEVWSGQWLERSGERWERERERERGVGEKRIRAKSRKRKCRR
jgi:hypothetical protein